MNGNLKPWMLVVTGIVFNIAAAVITHYFIGINHQKLDTLETQSARFDTLIDSQWRARTEILRSREFLLLLLSQQGADANPAVQRMLHHQLAQMAKQHGMEAVTIAADSAIEFDHIETLSTEISQQIIASINDTYLEKLELQQQVKPLQDSNALLLTVSISSRSPA